MSNLIIQKWKSYVEGFSTFHHDGPRGHAHQCQIVSTKTILLFGETVSLWLRIKSLLCFESANRLSTVNQHCFLRWTNRHVAIVLVMSDSSRIILSNLLNWFTDSLNDSIVHWTDQWFIRTSLELTTHDDIQFIAISAWAWIWLRQKVSYYNDVFWYCLL